jgi:hypothetical protein
MAEEGNFLRHFYLEEKDMDERLGSFKSLEDVYLKATYNTKINGKEFVEGETIAFFDRI